MIEEKQAFGSSPEGINHQVAVIVFDEQHGGNLGVGKMKPAQKAEVTEVISCNQYDIGRIRLYGVVQGRDVQCN